MAKSKSLRIEDLRPDEGNPNKGSNKGRAILRDAIDRLGLGRSIVVDKHGNVIAGNQTLEAARAAGVTELVVVDTDGTRPVVVQRTDLHLHSEEDGRARELSVADNRIGQLNRTWDAEALAPFLNVVKRYWTDREYARLFQAKGALGLDLPEDAEVESEPEEPQEAPAVNRVHLVSLFVSGDDQPPFDGGLRILAERYETTTVTDTILVALETASAHAPAD